MRLELPLPLYTTITAPKAHGTLDWGRELFLVEEDDLLASDMCLRFQVMGVRKWGQDVVLGQAEVCLEGKSQEALLSGRPLALTLPLQPQGRAASSKTQGILAAAAAESAATAGSHAFGVDSGSRACCTCACSCRTPGWLRSHTQHAYSSPHVRSSKAIMQSLAPDLHPRLLLDALRLPPASVLHCSLGHFYVEPCVVLLRIKIISASGIDRPVVPPSAPSGSRLLTAEASKNDPKLQQQLKSAAGASRLSASQIKPPPAAAVAGKDKGTEGGGKEEEGLNFFQRLQPGVAAAAQAVQSQFQEQAGKALRQSLSVFANIRGKQRESAYEQELAAGPAAAPAAAAAGTPGMWYVRMPAAAQGGMSHHPRQWRQLQPAAKRDNIANTRPATVTSPVPTAVASGADPLSRVIPGSDSGGSLSRQDGGSGSLDLRSKVVMSGRSGSGSFGARVASPTQQLTRGESGLMAALEENGFSSAGGPDLDLDDLVRDSDSVTDQLGAFHYVKVSYESQSHTSMMVQAQSGSVVWGEVCLFGARSPMTAAPLELDFFASTDSKSRGKAVAHFTTSLDSLLQPILAATAQSKSATGNIHTVSTNTAPPKKAAAPVAAITKLPSTTQPPQHASYVSASQLVPEPTAAAPVSALTGAALSKLQQESEILDPN
ncbi:MAG: hypothetical protein WDW38_005836 [Sanguina aurantia]